MQGMMQPQSGANSALFPAWYLASLRAKAWHTAMATTNKCLAQMSKSPDARRLRIVKSSGSDLAHSHSNFADNLRTSKSMKTTTSLAIMIAALGLLFVQFNALHN